MTVFLMAASASAAATGPNSGAVSGQATVQAKVDSTGVLDPTTLTLIGGVLVGLGLLGRKGPTRQ